MEKLSYEVRKIAEGVWAINEFDMDYAYVVEGERRSLLIDAGTGTGDLRGLVESLTKLPYDVVCTHGHVDHCGGIGQFSKVYMHPADVPGLLKSGDEGVISVFNRRRYAKLGLALHDPETLPFTLDTFQPVDTSKIEFLPVGEGTRFDLGGRVLEAFETPGHSMGCVCLLDREGRNLFSGDAVGRIQILHLPLSVKEQFRVWLKSARRIEGCLPLVDRVLSGHFCPLSLDLLRDGIACAEAVIAGAREEEYVEVDEYAGWMYREGQVYFTLREENLKGRDYGRIAARRRAGKNETSEGGF